MAVVVFDSADPDFFLAHYDIAADQSAFDALPAAPSPFHHWADFLIRLAKSRAVTISALRGRARGAGSEFALATDIRFASRERAVLGQFEVGFAAVPGGGRRVKKLKRPKNGSFVHGRHSGVRTRSGTILGIVNDALR